MRFLDALRGQSTRGRLLRAGLLTNASVMVAVILALMLCEFGTHRKMLEDGVGAQTRLLAADLSAALRVGDAQAGTEILSRLKATPYIEEATVFATGMAIFAAFVRDDADRQAGAGDVRHADWRHLEYAADIATGGRRLGEIVIRADLMPIYRDVAEDFAITTVVMAFGLAVSAVLLLRLQRSITDPLSQLTQLVERVSGGEDGLRAEVTAAGEVRVLADGINDMLSCIERRDRALGAELEDRLRTERQLIKLSLAVENAATGVLITDVEGTIEYANPKLRRISGYAADELVGRRPDVFKSGLTPPEVYADLWATVKDGREWRGELRNRRKDGEIYWSFHSISPIRDDSATITHFVASVEDITERKDAERVINRLAYFDPLTSLPNRQLFFDKLSSFLSAARRTGTVTAVFYLDLDRFKEVNDTFGHGAGDRLLCSVAERIKSVLRSEDVVARLGGDEFALILPHLGQAGDAAVAAQKVLAEMVRPVDIGGTELAVTASIGISVCPGDGAEPELLIKRADIALYRAKAAGRNNFCYFSAEMESHGVERMELETQLRQALDRKEFYLVYQPKMTLADGRVRTAEALLRWRHPQLGEVGPVRFIPVAEESRLIVPLGEWVIDEVARQMAAWDAAGLPKLSVAINLSAIQFSDSRLSNKIGGCFAAAGIAAERVELEITESVLMENPAAVESILQGFHRQGMTIAIDDFGTGYSSLGYLKRFPVDVLKIDRSFVRDLDTDPDDLAIAQAIVSMAKSLGLKVVAEGVETEPQLDVLRRLGCDLVQGYWLSRPLEAAAFAGFLAAREELRRVEGQAVGEHEAWLS